jgi:DNA-binding MarR family transcriptional regulator
MYMHMIMARKAQSPRSLRGDARRALNSCAAWNARLVARRLTQFFEERMAGAELPFAQFGLMAEIATAADDTITALALRMGLDQSTLSRTLRTLESDGLVEIAIADDDQRRRLVWLTEKGVRKLETALAAWRKAHAELARRLPVGFAGILALAADALEQDEATPGRRLAHADD